MTITILIPAWNGGRYIEAAILSALHQQRRPDEIIVFDDNSTDNTREICSRYKDRITLHHNPAGPSGFVNAWNQAIAAATGDYISILHQDDLLAPEFLAAAETALQQNPGVRHLFTTCHYIDEQGRNLSVSYPPHPSGAIIRYTGTAYFRAYQQTGEPHIHRCPGVITHRSIFRECAYNPAAGHIADDDFFYRVGMYTDTIGILTPMASYRIHEASVTGSSEDAALARTLIQDYLYQCRQWRHHPFPDAEMYQYFVSHARKFIRRHLGYGLRQKNPKMILHACIQWCKLQTLIS